MLHPVRRATPLLVPFLLVACNATRGPAATIYRTEKLPGEGLEQAQPADIALAPIRNQTENPRVPLESLREAFYHELAARLYSPLSLEYVDANWSEASFGGTASPDATLIVAITHWDTTHMLSRGVVTAAADLRLWSGGGASGVPLWGVSLTRELILVDTKGPAGLSRDLLPKAVEMLAAEALGELPERDAVSARR